jgi:CRISPR-associated endonuclease/helicase Cas3
MIPADDFAAFFEEAHGATPFPWQKALARRVLAGEWPACIALPTAAGKTAMIDIAVFALAAGAPGAARRIFFVVDRRLVVDEAAERAERLRKALGQAEPNSVLGRVSAALMRLAGPDAVEPLQVGTLRGGLALRDTWARSPIQPAVLCSTVDQVGSSLLFRAYGSRSNYNWPIRAGLAGNDALVIVDEAHIAQPFLQTLGAIEKYRGVLGADALKTPFRVIEMSATPREASSVFTETDEDRQPGSTLQKRWSASKPARLIVAGTEGGGAGEGNFSGLIDEMVKQARRLREEGAAAIGVVANRVATAREIHNRLGSEAELLIGRSRPFDREAIWKRVAPQVALGRKPGAPPVYLVATQCIEVGANLDFDGLVTEAASIDALEQRFGRLNREGREVASPAAIVAQKDQTGAKYDDAIYGSALLKTWGRLVKAARKKGKVQTVDMGVDAIRMAIRPADRDGLVAPRVDAPVLLPAHLDRLAETSPEPAISPEPALFLHGPKAGPADVSVVWRADLDPKNPKAWAEAVERVPPRPEETMAVPVWAVRRWLQNGSSTIPDVADVEGQIGDSDSDSDERPVLLWRGTDESRIVTEARPGSTIVVPAIYGGADEWGWHPGCNNAVTDVADLVSLQRGRPTLRFAAGGLNGVPDEVVSSLRSAESDDELRTALKQLAVAAADGAVAEIATRLSAARNLRQFRTDKGDEDEDGTSVLIAVAAAGGFEQESVASSYTVPTQLDKHLQQCGRRAGTFAELAGLTGRLARTVVEAARLHDIGKADQRFQAWLRGGNPASSDEAPLAKSGGNGRDKKQRDRARLRSRYPNGARHELQSIALLERDKFDTEIDRDLLLHLIASHHGRCRPFAPVVFDEEPVHVRYEGWEASSKHELHAVDSGISERFWRLTRRYGWWGLAWLESIVRLADQRQSEAEQEGRQNREEEMHAVGAN